MDNIADPNVNLEDVSALNHSRSISFVNNFVSRTAEFLNRYVHYIELLIIFYSVIITQILRYILEVNK